MKNTLILILFSIVFTQVVAQKKSSPPKKIYKLNHKVEIPVIAGLFALNIYGFGRIMDKPTLDSTEIVALNSDDIWAFDRRAAQQSPSGRESAQTISDWAMNVSIFLPTLLFIDKKIRRDWLDITIMYLETQAINSNIYTWLGPMYTKRIRPFVYHPDVPFEDKLEVGTTDSFFSGHTSWTATASFFTAQVFIDYYPELGGKKWWLYGAALVPPVFVGFFRYKAMKHFPTDIMLGTAVGAFMGVFIPYLHKIKHNKNQNLSLVPFTGNVSGLAMKFKF